MAIGVRCVDVLMLLRERRVFIGGVKIAGMMKVLPVTPFPWNKNANIESIPYAVSYYYQKKGDVFGRAVNRSGRSAKNSLAIQVESKKCNGAREPAEVAG